MAPSLVDRARHSLQLRLLLTTVALVALALLVAAIAFERVAQSVVVGAVHSHLSVRAKEIHEAVQRFQRERALTVRNWAEAEAMQMTLDLGDPKFAEDYLRRVIQDQGGSISVAALIGLDGMVKAAVRSAPDNAPLGLGVPEARDLFVEDLPAIYLTEPSAEVFIGWDLKDIRRYKEFELSPQGEWIDLDVNKNSEPGVFDDKWNAGMESAALIDRTRRVWYGEMKIPIRSIDARYDDRYRQTPGPCESCHQIHRLISWHPFQNFQGARFHQRLPLGQPCRRQRLCGFGSHP